MISVQDLSLTQGSFSIARISFQIPSGHYAVLMGRTGSGKTSIIEAICGLRRITKGQIVLKGRDVAKCRPAQRGVGYVPQDTALFETMSVRDHLAFALQVRRWPKKDVEQRVAFLAEVLEIEDLLRRFPFGLSGGERQRVALGRALSFEPGILLMDEPLSALDEESREHMYDVLTRVRENSPITVLHVTHSSHEAERLADLILKLRDGRVETAWTANKAIG